MSKLKVQLNSAGVQKILKSDGIQSMLKERASAVKKRCGSGYDQDIHIGKNRANTMIWADTYQAKRDNKRNNTLLKAVRSK